jgi:hypothetical protein
MEKTRNVAVTVVALAALAVASSAVAAGGGNGKSSSSISLVVMSATRTAADVGARYGDQVTFDVSTNATDRPYVLLNCYQNGVWVLAGQAGFWASYPSKTFMLASTWWTGGAATCTARLGSINADGTRFRELASTSFDVAG